MAETRQVVDELERRRALDRERSRRYRAKPRQIALPTHSVVVEPAAGARSPSFPVHVTKRLESIGSTPEAYGRIPPHLEVPEAAAAAPTADQEAGARKVAMVVAGMFNLALNDASTRYELGERLGAAGVKPEDAGKVFSAAVSHVHDSTMRACLKHGIGIALPYEDELTAIGAATLSTLYLAAKYTGRLDELEKRPKAVGEKKAKRAEPVDDGPENDNVVDPYSPVKIESI